MDVHVRHGRRYSLSQTIRHRIVQQGDVYGNSHKDHGDSTGAPCSTTGRFGPLEGGA